MIRMSDNEAQSLDLRGDHWKGSLMHHRRATSYLLSIFGLYWPIECDLAGANAEARLCPCLTFVRFYAPTRDIQFPSSKGVQITLTQTYAPCSSGYLAFQEAREPQRVEWKSP